MNTKNEQYTPEEIEYARKYTEMLHTCDYSGMLIAEIEEKLHTNYQTFRAWYMGFVDYFDDKLSLIATLFKISVDNLVGRVVELRAKF